MKESDLFDTQIELRWLHDPFSEIEDISDDAVLVLRGKDCASGDSTRTPLILQYRHSERIAGFPHRVLTEWKTVKYVVGEK